MEYRNRLQQFGPGPSEAEITSYVRKAGELAAANTGVEIYKACLSCLDVTWLSETDNEEGISSNAEGLLELWAHNPQLPPFAAVCVFPNFVDTVGLAVGDSNVRIASVAGAFPDAQTFLEVKMLEAAMAVENGADEIDIVMNPGLILAGKYEEAANEIETIRREIGEDVTMKVIIESGVLGSHGNIRAASLLAMMAGADFVKISTGRKAVGATAESAAAICCAIRDYAAATGRKVGFKAAGGVRTPEQATDMYSVVESVLGREWLNPALFRIGSSTLYRDLLARLGI